MCQAVAVTLRLIDSSVLLSSCLQLCLHAGYLACIQEVYLQQQETPRLQQEPLNTVAT